MSWFRVDDNFHDHPKVDELLAGKCGEAALALWLLAGTWCSKHKTNGAVPAIRLERFGLRRALEAAEALVAAGLWDLAEGGYSFHDWDDYRPANETKAAERARRYRDRKRDASRDGPRDADRDGVRDGERDASRDDDRDVTASRAAAPTRVPAHPVPSRPVPSRPKGEGKPHGPPPSVLPIGPMPLAPTLAKIYGEQRAEKIPIPYEHFQRDRVSWDTVARAVAAYAAKRTVPSDDIATRVIARFLALDALRSEAWPPRWFADRIDGLLLELDEPPRRPRYDDPDAEVA